MKTTSKSRHASTHQNNDAAKIEETKTGSRFRALSDMLIVAIFFVLVVVLFFLGGTAKRLGSKANSEALRTEQVISENMLLEEELSGMEEKVNNLVLESAQQEDRIMELQTEMSEIENELAGKEEQITQLVDENTQLRSQMEEIEAAIAERTALASVLQSEFDSNDLDAYVDPDTGTVSFEADVLFDVGDSTFTDEGKAILDTVLQAYLSVLLEDYWQEYLSEIVVVGYTDPSGEYADNMELSLDRACAVAEYLLLAGDAFLDSDSKALLESELTVCGRSESESVFDETGEVDMDASRRVELRYSFDNEDLAAEISDILNEES